MEYEYYRVAEALRAAGADGEALNAAGHPADRGMGGRKHASAVLLGCANTSSKELSAALATLEALAQAAPVAGGGGDARHPALEDRAALAQIRLRQKGRCAGWTADVDARFKTLLHALAS